MLDQSAEGLQDVFLLDEGHLAVDLGEFGLAVAPEVFVAKALADLVVAIHACHHKQLLENLGALWQRIEAAWLQARRHQEIARALGGTLDEHRCFDLGEVLRVEVAAHGLHDAVAQADAFGQLGAADVEVAVLQAQLFGAVGVVFDQEGWGLRGIEHFDRGGHDFDVASRELGVFVFAFANGA